MPPVKSHVAIVIALLTKASLQQWRDPFSLILILLTAPIFVVIYHLAYGEGAQISPQQFVPSLLIFAVIMLIFSTALSIAREVDSGMLEKLRLTSMTPGHYLLSTAVFQLFLGLTTVGLTFGVALLYGFESTGHLGLAFAIIAVTAVACVGLGCLIGALSPTPQSAFLFSSATMFLLLLFSGALFPIPDASTVSLLGSELSWLDLLPTVHAVESLGAVLLMGHSLIEVAPALVTIFCLAVIFFALGAFSFSRRQRLPSLPPG